MPPSERPKPLKGEREGGKNQRFTPYARPVSSSGQALSSTQSTSVAHHYNARPDQGIAGRRTSKIIRLRSFNNWVKMTLIRRFAASCKDAQTGQFRVLDLGCGKGGDLHKWGSVDVTSYVGCGRWCLKGGEGDLLYLLCWKDREKGMRTDHTDAPEIPV